MRRSHDITLCFLARPLGLVSWSIYFVTRSSFSMFMDRFAVRSVLFSLSSSSACRDSTVGLFRVCISGMDPHLAVVHLSEKGVPSSTNRQRGPPAPVPWKPRSEEFHPYQLWQATGPVGVAEGGGVILGRSPTLCSSRLLDVSLQGATLGMPVF